MKESRLNYKAKRPKGFDSYSDEKNHHTSSRSKTQQREREVRNIDRAIRTKDLRVLMEDTD
jgi:hypothetical protein